MRLFRSRLHVLALALVLVVLGTLALLGLCAQLAQAQTVPDLSHPLLRNLVSWWRGVPGLTHGDRFFDLVSRYHGTLTNMGFSTTSGWNATDRRGALTHLAFDGTDDWINVGNQAAFNFANAAFSVAAWFRSSTTGVQQYLVAKRNSTNEGWHIRIGSGNLLEVRLNDATQGVTANSGSLTVTDGLWHQFVGVFTTDSATTANNTCTAYLDGVQVGTASGSAMLYVAPSSGNLAFGSLSDGSANRLNGAMASVAIWARALSAAEVTEVYRQGQFGAPGLLQGPSLPVAMVPAVKTDAFFPFMH